MRKKELRVLKGDLRQRARRVIDRLPSVSVSASKLLRALSKSDAEPRELVSIIKNDPMLAPHVLEVANSAGFGRLSRIKTIQHATALLGPGVLRRYALKWVIGGCFRGLPTPAGWPFERFRIHSDATALLCDTLCQYMPVRGRDGAFIAGLVHDVGKFVIYAAEPDAVNMILAMREMSEHAATRIERDVLGIDHAEVSSMAAEKWRLPDDICQAVRWHHEPDQDRSSDEIPLSLVLSKADRFVNGLGMSFLSSSSDAAVALEWVGHEREVQRALQSFEAALRAEITHRDEMPSTPEKCLACQEH